MNEDVIYPTMVIRSQAETIELQEKEIDRLNNIINGLEIDKKVLDDLCMELEYRYTPITELRVMDIQDFINKRFDKLKELKEEGK